MNSKIDELKRLSTPKKPSTPEKSSDFKESTFVIFFATKYLENDLQCIFKTVLEVKILATLVIFPDKPYERLLKTRFPDVY